MELLKDYVIYQAKYNDIFIFKPMMKSNKAYYGFIFEEKKYSQRQIYNKDLTDNSIIVLGEL